jgi:hypothetical protein
LNYEDYAADDVDHYTDDESYYTDDEVRYLDIINDEDVIRLQKNDPSLSELKLRSVAGYLPCRPRVEAADLTTLAALLRTNTIVEKLVFLRLNNDDDETRDGWTNIFQMLQTKKYIKVVRIDGRFLHRKMQKR